jgi:putative transposase
MQEYSDCMLVLLGATPEGKKELIDFQVGDGKAARAGAIYWST